MNFQNVFRLEKNRFLDKRRIVILLVFFLLSVYFIQSGIGQYKSNPEEIQRFQEFEKSRIEHFLYYDQYGTYGFRLLFVPGSLSALFNNAGIFDTKLNAFIDSGERMKIYESFKGKNVFLGYTSVFLNLSGLLFLLGSLLVLFYGLESYRDRDFIEFLDSIKGNRKNLFWSALTSRLLLLLGACLLIAITTWFLYFINGVAVNVGYLMVYGLVFFLMFAFFLFAGMLAGALRNRRAGLITVFSVWLLFIFGLPAIVGSVVYSRAKSITPPYKMDIEKFRLMMNIEKKAKEQIGRMKRDNTNTEVRRKLHEYFWSNQFKQIFSHEQNMINQMKGFVSLHHNLSLIFPTSFFLSVNNEISGRGYESLISFYEYALKHKRGFVQYYAEKSFYLGEETVRSYLKGDENIFHASSMLPGNFGFGLVIGFFWLLGLLFFNWLAFNRLLDRRSNIDSAGIKELKPQEFKKNRITNVLTFNHSLLSGFLETLRRQGSRYIFAPGPDCLPGDVKVKRLFDLFGLAVPDALKPLANKYVSCLEADYKALAIMEISRLNHAEFYIFNNFLAGLSDTFEKHFAESLEVLKKGRKVVYFTNSVPRVGDDFIRHANERQFQ
jgi:ABC-type transport system involved in multi-copper enzyme maturation permease subunit